MDSRPKYKKTKAIKFIEESTQGNVHDIDFGNDTIGMTAKAQVTKENIDKLNYIKI